MKYASIRTMDISNGEGIGVSLFVQGCHFHCPGCFNKETWDFNGGKEWTEEVKNRFLQCANKTYIKRISILGGEPLCDENVKGVLALIKEIRKVYPDKKIWLYTGYKLEDILLGDNIDRVAAIMNSDIVVDGQFEIAKQDLYNDYIVWAGSTNQRVIDMNKFKKGETVINGD